MIACQARGLRPLRCKAPRGACLKGQAPPVMPWEKVSPMSSWEIRCEFSRFRRGLPVRKIGPVPFYESGTCGKFSSCADSNGRKVKGGTPLESGLECDVLALPGQCPGGLTFEDRSCRGIAPRRRSAPLPGTAVSGSSWLRVSEPWTSKGNPLGFDSSRVEPLRPGEEHVDARMTALHDALEKARHPGGAPWAPAELKGFAVAGRRDYPTDFPRRRNINR